MSSFYLWLDSAKTGPHSLASIWHALDGGEVRPETLCCEVGGPDQWTPIKDCPAFTPGRALRAKAPEPITPAQFLQDSAQPVQAAPAATPGLNSTVAQALDHAARSQAALAEAIRSVGSGFVIAAKLALGLAGLVLVISFLASVGATDAARQPEPATGGFILGGACVAAAAWLYLIGQVVLIRAALEQRSESGEKRS